MKALSTNQGTTIPAVSLILVTLAGCADPAGPQANTPVEPRETPWVEQIAALRSGGANAVRTSRAPVTAEQWAMLDEGCQSLEILEADVRLLGPDEFDRLAALPKLRQLILHGPVDDIRLQRIAALPTIEVLNLPAAEITDAGLSMLAALPRLELLRLGSPHVTDEGMRAVAALPALRFLHLIDVPITDAGLVHLHGLTELESFYLDGGRCTDEGLHALLHALPELHFHRDQLHLSGDPHTHPHEGVGSHE